jgi:hypothetical protein
VSLNGSFVEAERSDGYARLTRIWEAGDAVVLTLPMPARFVAGHPLIESTRSSVAIVRGPLVYCIEACDQSVVTADATVTIDPRTPLQSVWRPELLGGAATIVASGNVHHNDEWTCLYRPLDDISRERRAVEVTAVPYFLWGNRERGSMTVWIPIESD